jgi:hypothetical protein
VDFEHIIHMPGSTPHPFVLTKKDQPRQRLTSPCELLGLRTTSYPVTVDQEDVSHQLLQPTLETSTLRTVRFSVRPIQTFRSFIVTSSNFGLFRAQLLPSEASLDGDAPASA